MAAASRSAAMGALAARQGPRLVGPPPDHGAVVLRAMAEDALVSTTWTARAQLWNRFARWCQVFKMAETPQSAALFVAAITQKKSTRRNYISQIKNFGAAMGRWEADNPTLIRMNELNSKGHQEENEQAVPMKHEELMALATRCVMTGKHDDAALLCVGWWTAARVGDLTNLLISDVQMRGAEVLVDWHKSKTLKQNPFRETRYSRANVTTWPQQAVEWLKKRVSEGRKEENVFDTTPRTVRGLLRTQRIELSDHSIRRGALWHVCYLLVSGKTPLAFGVSTATRQPLDMVRLVARHESIQTTLRYLAGCPYLPQLVAGVTMW